MQIPGLTTALTALVRRDARLYFYRRGELIQPLVFFTLVITLFPLSLGTSPTVLAMIAPAVIWVMAVLSTLLAAESLFKSDYTEGVLEQWLLSSQPLSTLLSLKVLLHWAVTGLPLTLLATVLGSMLSVPQQALSVLTLTLLLGTPILSFISAIGSALTVSLPRAGVLITLIVLPLYIPVLIVANQAVLASIHHEHLAGYLACLLAFLLLTLALAPFAIAAGLRINIQQ